MMKLYITEFSRMMRNFRSVAMAVFLDFRLTIFDFRLTRINSQLFKIAAMVAVLVLGSTEVQAQRRQGFVNAAPGEVVNSYAGTSGIPYFGLDAAMPLHNQALPSITVGTTSNNANSTFNNSTASNGLNINPGTLVQRKCATATSGAIFELVGFSMGTPSTSSYNQFTGSLFYYAQAANANAWRRMINHAGGIPATQTGMSGALNLADGVIWLIVHWGEGVNARYELTLNNNWQLVPRWGIFFQYEIGENPPCNYTFQHLQLQAYRCNNAVPAGTAGPNDNRSCTSIAATQLIYGTLPNFYGLATSYVVNNPQVDTDLRFQISSTNTNNEYTVCAGDVNGRQFIDLSRFKCNGDRYVQFEYIWRKGTGNANTGTPEIASASTGGTIYGSPTTTASFSNGGISAGATTGNNGRRLISNGAAGGTSNSTTSFIRLPADAQNGDVLEVRMYTWNACRLPSNLTTPTATDRAAHNDIKSAFIRVVAPTEKIRGTDFPWENTFCYPAGGIVNNYSIQMVQDNLLPITQAVSYNYYAPNAAGTGPGVKIAVAAVATGSGSFDPSNTAVTAAYRLLPTGTAAERSRTYFVTYVNAGGCESLPAKVTFKVRDNISTAPVITGTASVCAGSTYRFQVSPYVASSGGDALSYVWMNGTGYSITATADANGRTGQWADITFTAAATVRMFRMWTDQVSNIPSTCPGLPADVGGWPVGCNNCFSAICTYAVSINNPPTATLSGGVEICGHETATLSIGNLTGGTSYNLTVEGNDGFSQTFTGVGAGGTTFTVNPAPGTSPAYTITAITATGNSCPGTGGSNTQVAKRALLSVAAATISTTPLCENDNFTATFAPTINPSEQLVWTYNGLQTPGAAGVSSITYNAGAATTGRNIDVYLRYATPVAGRPAEYCASTLQHQSVVVTQAPSATIAPASASQAVCDGSPAAVTVNVSGGTAGENYTVEWGIWHNGSQVGTSVTTPPFNTSSTTVTVPAGLLNQGRGDYTFQLSAVDRANSCNSITPTASALIVVEQMPDAEVFTANQDRCEGIPVDVSLTVSGETGRPYSIEYTINDIPQESLKPSASVLSSFNYGFTIPGTMVTGAPTTLTLKITSVEQEGGKSCKNLNPTPSQLVIGVQSVAHADPNPDNLPYSLCPPDFTTERRINLKGNLPGQGTLPGGGDEYYGEWTVTSGNCSGNACIEPDLIDHTKAVIKATSPELYTVMWTIRKTLDPACYSSRSTTVFFSQSTTVAEVFYPTDEVCFDSPYELWAVRPTPGKETGMWELWEVELASAPGIYYGEHTWWTVTNGLLPNGLSLNSVTGEISGTPDVAGTYTVTITGENIGTDDVIPLTIEIYPSGYGSASYPDGEAGSPYSYTLTSDISKTPIPSGWIEIDDDGDYRTGVKASLNELGTYKFRWSVIGGCSTESDFTTVTFVPKPYVQKIAPFELCSEQIIVMPPFVAVDKEDGVAPGDALNDTGYEYRWQFVGAVMDGFTSGSLPGQFPTGRYTPLTKSNAWETYNVGVEVNNGICWSDRINVQMQLKPKPSLVQLSRTSLCEGEEVSMRLASNMWQDTKYNWEIVAGSDVIVDPGNGNYTLSGTSGSYDAGDEDPPFSFRFATINGGDIPKPMSIDATATVNGCTGNVAHLELTVNPKPMLTKPANIEICPTDATGAPIQITAAETTVTSNVADTHYTWTWNGINIGFTTPSNVAGETYSMTNTLGNFNVIDNISSGKFGGKMTVSGETYGCVSDAVDFDIYVKPRPNIVLPIIPPPPCPISNVGGTFPSITFRTSNIPVGQADYEWTMTPPSGAAVSGTEATPTDDDPDVFNFVDNKSGTPDIYNWTVSATGNSSGSANSCFSDVSTFAMSVLPRPVIVINNANTAACSGDPAFSTVSFSTGVLSSNYSWTVSTPPALTGGVITTGAANMYGFGNTVSFSGSPVNTSNAVSGGGYETYAATITVNATSTDGCAADEDYSTLTVLQAPVMSPPDALELCSGDTKTGGYAFAPFIYNEVDIEEYEWTIDRPAILNPSTTSDTNAIGMAQFTVAANTTSAAETATITVRAKHDVTACLSSPVSFPLMVRPELRLTSWSAANNPIIACPNDPVSIPSFTSNVYGSDASMITWKYTGVNDKDVSLDGYFITSDFPAGITSSGNIGTFYAATNGGSAQIEGKFTVTVESHWSEGSLNCPSAPVDIIIQVNPAPPKPTLDVTLDADDAVFYCHSANDPETIGFISTIPTAHFSWTGNDDLAGGNYSGTGNALSFLPVNNTLMRLWERMANYSVRTHADFAGNGKECPSAATDFTVIIRPVPQINEGYNSIITGCSDTEFELPEFTHHTLFSPTGYNSSTDPDPNVYHWEFTALDNTPSWTTGATGLPALDVTSTVNPVAPFTPHITGNGQRSLMLTVIPEYEGCQGVQKDIVININPTPMIMLQNVDGNPYTDFERCSDAEPFSDIYLQSTLPLNRGYVWELQPYQTADETQHTNNGATSGITGVSQTSMAATFGNHRPHNSHVTQYREVFRFVTAPTAMVGNCKAQLVGDSIFIINQAPAWGAVDNIVACSEEIIAIPAFSITNVAEIGAGNLNYTWETNNATVWNSAGGGVSPNDWTGLDSNGTLNPSLQFSKFKTTRNDNLTDNSATVTLKAQITGGCASEEVFAVAVKTFPVIENFLADANGLREDAFCFGETVANASFITNVYGVTHTNVSWKINPAISDDIFGGAFGATPFDGSTRSGNISFAAGNTANANLFPAVRASQTAIIEIWVDDSRNHANLYNGLGYCRSDILEWEITVHPTPEIIQTGVAIASPYCPVVDQIPLQTFSTNPALQTGDYIEWRSVGSVGNATSDRNDYPLTGTGSQTLTFGGFNAVNTGFTNTTATVTVTAGVGAKTNGDLCRATNTLPTITVKPRPQLSPGYITTAQVCSGEEMNLTPFQLHPGFTGQPGWDNRETFIWSRINPTPDWTVDNNIIDQIATGLLPGLSGTADENSTTPFALDMFKPVIKDANRHSFTIRVKPELDGCFGDEHDVEITINPTPKVSVDGDLLVCSGSSFTDVTLKTDGNVPVNWAWILEPQGGPYSPPNIPTAGASSETGNTSVIRFNTPAQSFNNTVYQEQIQLGSSPDYKITSTAAWGSCEAVMKDNYFLTVLQTPAINTLAPVVICSNADHPAITFGTSNVSPPTTAAYSWTTTNAGVWNVTAGSGTQIPAFTAQPYMSTGAPPLASTDVNSATVRVTAGIDHSAAFPAMTTACTSTQSFTIQVKPLPEIRSGLADQTVCAGDAVTGVPFVTNVTGSNNPEYVHWTIRNDLVTPSVSDHIFGTGAGTSYVVGGNDTGNISFPSTATGSVQTAYFDLHVRMPYSDLTHWSAGASSTDKYCESDLQTLRINVNPTPVISHAPLFDQPGPPPVTGLLKDAYCHNDWTSAADITFTVSPVPAATDEFRWDRTGTGNNVGGAASQIATGASLTFPRFQVQNNTSPASLTSKTALYTVSAAVGSRINAYLNPNNGNACTATETFPIVVKPRPELAAFTSPISHCSGDEFVSPNIQLHSGFVSNKTSPINTDTKFTWTVTTSNDWFNTPGINISDASEVFPGSDTDVSPLSGGYMGAVSLFESFKPLIAGSNPQYVYFDIVPEHDECAGGVQTLQLTVRPAPIITGINDTIVCSGEKFFPIDLNGIVSTPSTFTWSFLRATPTHGEDPGLNSTGFPTLNSGARIEFDRNTLNEHTEAFGGSFLTIYAKANGADGCTSRPVTREFIVLQAPVMSDLLDIQVCSEEEITNFIPLTLNPPSGADPLSASRYEWELTPNPNLLGVWVPAATGVNVAASGTTWMSDFKAGANNGSVNLSNDINVFAVAEHSATYGGRECKSRPSKFALIRRPNVLFNQAPADPLTRCDGDDVTLSPDFNANADATILWKLDDPTIVYGLTASDTFEGDETDFPITFKAENKTTSGKPGIFGATAQTPRALPLATSGYGITGMKAYCESADPAAFTVTIHPIPTITVQDAEPVCSGNDAIVPAFASNIGTSYNWRTTQTDKDNIGWIFSGTTGNGNMGTIVGVTNGANTLLPATATVEARAGTNNCFSDWTPFTITVKPIPQMTFSFPNGGEVCSTDDVEPDEFELNSTTWGHYTDAADRATLNFRWTVLENWFAGSGLPQPATPPLTYPADYETGFLPALFTPELPSGQGITDLRARIYPEFLGCVGTPITSTLTVKPLTVISISAPEAVCSGDAFSYITVRDVNNVGGLSYGFNLDPVNSASGDPTVGNPTVSGSRINFTSSKNTGMLPYDAEIEIFAIAAVNNCRSLPAITTLRVYPEPIMTPPDPIDECSGVVFGDVSGYTSTTPYKFSTAGNNQRGFVWSMSGDKVWDMAPNLTDQFAVGTNGDELPGFVTCHDGRANDMSATVSVYALHKDYLTTAHPNGCPSTPETFTFKVRLAPTITLPTITPLCPETDVTLTPVTIITTGIPTGQATLHWASVTGNNISDDFTGTPFGTGQIPPFRTHDINDVPTFVQGTFNIWATREYDTGQFCETARQTLTVDLNPAPAKPIPGNADHKWEWCPNIVGIPSSVPSIGFLPVDANITYTWQQTNGVTVGLPAGSIDHTDPLPPFTPQHSASVQYDASIAEFIVTAKDNTTACINTETFSITVLPVPQMQILDPVEVCGGEVFDFASEGFVFRMNTDLVNNYPSAEDYEWRISSGWIPQSDLPQSAVQTGNITGWTSPSGIVGGFQTDIDKTHFVAPQASNPLWSDANTVVPVPVVMMVRPIYAGCRGTEVSVPVSLKPLPITTLPVNYDHCIGEKDPQKTFLANGGNRRIGTEYDWKIFNKDGTQVVSGLPEIMSTSADNYAIIEFIDDGSMWEGTLTLQETNWLGCKGEIVSMPLAMLPFPILDVLPENRMVNMCYGAAEQIHAYFKNADQLDLLNPATVIDYNWYPAPLLLDIPGNFDTLEPWIKTAMSQQFSVSVKVNGCTSDNAAIEVVVHDQVLSPRVPSVIVCEGDPLMTMTAYNANSSIVWERVDLPDYITVPGAVFNSVDETSTANVRQLTDGLPASLWSPDVGQTSTDVQYRVTQFDTFAGGTLVCPSEPTMTALKINRTPLPPDNNVFTYCEDPGNQLYELYTGTTQTNVVSYNWYRPEDDPATDMPYRTGYQIRVSQPGNSEQPDGTMKSFDYKVLTRSIADCPSEPVTIPLFVYPNPDLSFRFEDAVGNIIDPMQGFCSPYRLIGRNISPSADANYEWRWAAGITSPAPLNDTIGHVYRVSGTISETIRFNFYGISTVYKNSETGVYCSSEKEQPLIINPGVIASFFAVSGEACHPMNVDFTSTSINAYNFRWYWNTPTPPGFTPGSPVIPKDNPGPGEYYGMMGPNPPHVFVNTTPDPLNYHVWLQVDNGFCFDNKDTTITVYPVPVAAFDHNLDKTDPSICPPLPVIFTNNSGGPGTANNNQTGYIWEWGDSSRDTTFTDNPVSHHYENWISSVPMRHRVNLYAFNTYSTSNGNLICTSKEPYYQNIFVNPQVEARFTGPVEGCSPMTDAWFQNQSIGLPTQAGWDFGDGGSSTAVHPTHTFISQSGNYKNWEDYTIRLISGNSWCKDTVTHDFRLYPQPAASFTVDELSGCQPFMVTFTNNSNTIGSGNPADDMTYHFDFSDGYWDTFSDVYKTNILNVNYNDVWDLFTSEDKVKHTFTNVQGSDVVMNPWLAATKQWITQSNDTLRCISERFTQRVTVFPYLKAQLEVPDTIGCSPFSARLLNGSLGYLNYDYTFDNGVTQPIIVPGDQSSGRDLYYDFNALNMYEDIVYSVKLSVVSGHSCKDSITKKVTVLSTPRADFRPGSPYPADYPYPPPPIGIENLIQSPDKENLAYEWSWTNLETLQKVYFNDTPDPVELHLHDWGSYAITQNVTAPNPLGKLYALSCSDVQTRIINIVPTEPVAKFEDVAPDCMPYEVQFINTSSFARAYKWDFGDGSISSDQYPKHEFSRPDTFNVMLVAFGYNMLSDTVYKKVVVHPLPHASFDVQADFLWVGQAVNVINYTKHRDKNGNEYDVWYRWNWGDHSPEDIGENPSHYYLKSGKFDITLTAASRTDPPCISSFTMYDAVTLESAGDIILPNAFKPDSTGEQSDEVPAGGNRNYLFFPPVLSPTEKYSMMIYSRVGQLLYRTDDRNRGWNGYFRGKLCDEGVYIYKVEGVFTTGSSFAKTGDVTLLR